jgi:hypothetical protein
VCSGMWYGLLKVSYRGCSRVWYGLFKDVVWVVHGSDISALGVVIVFKDVGICAQGCGMGCSRK